MCKGVSSVFTEQDVYWLEDSNSHTVIKKAFNLNDNHKSDLKELLIVEAIPVGESFLSQKETDWKIIFENKPVWFNEHRETQRVFDWLFNTALATYKRLGIIKSLDLSSLDYKKMPDFGGLIITELDCSNNQLTSLDAPNATELRCYNNQLTSLDAPNATKLDCSNNQLTSLDAPNATVLYCSNNQLTSLDAPNATVLYCSNNPNLKR
ncbi:MAG: hypothetical protein WC356_02680 [Candidatus Micrarchaeia archaeon]|jgi:Leucine-rich repeat (LRR) protein